MCDAGMQDALIVLEQPLRDQASCQTMVHSLFAYVTVRLIFRHVMLLDKKHLCFVDQPDFFSPVPGCLELSLKTVHPFPDAKQIAQGLFQSSGRQGFRDHKNPVIRDVLKRVLVDFSRNHKQYRRTRSFSRIDRQLVSGFPGKRRINDDQIIAALQQTAPCECGIFPEVEQGFSVHMLAEYFIELPGSGDDEDRARFKGGIMASLFIYRHKDSPYLKM